MGKKISNHPHGSWEWFSDYFIPEPNSGCFLWVHGCDGGNYGYVRYHGRQQGAHRVAWRIANGSIPCGMGVLHGCDNTFCVNPAHLFLGTQRDNVQDMIAKGRSRNISSQCKVKTHCPSGHRYDMVDSSGFRRCRKCREEYQGKRCRERM